MLVRVVAARVLLACCAICERTARNAQTCGGRPARGRGVFRGGPTGHATQVAAAELVLPSTGCGGSAAAAAAAHAGLFEFRVACLGLDRWEVDAAC